MARYGIDSDGEAAEALFGVEAYLDWLRDNGKRPSKRIRDKIRSLYENHGRGELSGQ